MAELTELKRIRESGDAGKIKRMGDRLTREIARALKAEKEVKVLQERMARIKKDEVRRQLRLGILMWKSPSMVLPLVSENRLLRLTIEFVSQRRPRRRLVRLLSRRAQR